MESESTELVKVELQNNLLSLATEDQIKFVQKVASKFMPMSTGNSGKEFWTKHMLSSKDYPTDSMKFYQAVTEGKGRIGRLLDESVAYQELLLDIEELELEIDDLFHEISNKPSTTEILKKEISLRRKEIKLKQKKIKLEMSKTSIDCTLDEIKDFSEIAEEFERRGVKPFKEARVEELDEKRIDRYVHHCLSGVPLTNPEWSFYYDNGVVVPPREAIERLRKLGRHDLAKQEEEKLLAYEKFKNHERIECALDFGIKIVSKEDALR